MRNEEIMSRPPACCQEGEMLSAAAAQMWDHDCGAVPIVDGEGRLCGILTDRDICMAAYTKDALLREIPIHEVMTRDVVSCTVEDDIRNAEELMRSRQVRRVPIVDADRHVVGILSMNDITRRAISAPGDGATEHDVVDTLAAICEPRFAAGREEAAAPSA